MARKWNNLNVNLNLGHSRASAELLGQITIFGCDSHARPGATCWPPLGPLAQPNSPGGQLASFGRTRRASRSAGQPDGRTDGRTGGKSAGAGRPVTYSSRLGLGRTEMRAARLDPPAEISAGRLRAPLGQRTSGRLSSGRRRARGAFANRPQRINASQLEALRRRPLILMGPTGRPHAGVPAATSGPGGCRPAATRSARIGIDWRARAGPGSGRAGPRADRSVGWRNWGRRAFRPLISPHGARTSGRQVPAARLEEVAEGHLRSACRGHVTECKCRSRARVCVTLAGRFRGWPDAAPAARAGRRAGEPDSSCRPARRGSFD